MSLFPKQIGLSQEYYLLYEIYKNLDRLEKVMYSMVSDIATVDVSGPDVILDMGNKLTRYFISSGTISGARDWSFINDGNSAEIPSFTFTVSGLGAQQMPSNVVMLQSEGQWDNGAKTWTPLELGDYVAEASFNGTTWFLKIFGPF